MSTINLPPYIDVLLKASHIDFVNENAVRYTTRAAKKGASSFVYPYKKPQLVGHDKKRDPIGRITDAKVVTNKTPTDPNEPPTYLQLTARITDEDAIAKILDGRYNTVSVGSRTNRVICSECDTVITEEGLCEHKKGSYNDKGLMIHWIIDQLTYVEDSFVNEPADRWAGIESINIGAGWVAYQEFMDNRESLLAEITIKDSNMPKNADSKLTAEQRKKLSDSTFCGPGRTFPAHDKAHVLAGLEAINSSELSDEIKSKVIGALYRRGKRVGVTPSKDELEANPDLLTARLDDDWTEEEISSVEDFFKENPDADLPGANEEETQEDETQENEEEETPDISKLKVADLRSLVGKLQKQIEDNDTSHKEAISVRDKKIETLEKKVQDSETLILQRDDEINKYLDENAVLDRKLRDSIISNIIDLKMTDNNNEDINALRDRLGKRQTESLIDTLEDLRTGTPNETNSDERVEDSTLKTEDTNSDEANTDQNTDKGSKDKFSIFNQDRKF